MIDPGSTHPSLTFFQADQVYLPQVRPLRHAREARRPLRARHQHHQREDLRVPLVDVVLLEAIAWFALTDDRRLLVLREAVLVSIS